STAYFFSVVHRNECCLVSSLFPYTTLFRSIYFTFGGEVKPYDIIGVVEDFNFESLRDPVSPLGFFLEDNYTQAAFKIETANLSTLLGQMEEAWNKLAPGYPFAYRFMDDAFDNMYRVERRVGQLSI